MSILFLKLKFASHLGAFEREFDLALRSVSFRPSAVMKWNRTGSEREGIGLFQTGFSKFSNKYIVGN